MHTFWPDSCGCLSTELPSRCLCWPSWALFRSRAIPTPQMSATKAPQMTTINNVECEPWPAVERKEDAFGSSYKTFAKKKLNKLTLLHDIVHLSIWFLNVVRVDHCVSKHVSVYASGNAINRDYLKLGLLRKYKYVPCCCINWADTGGWTAGEDCFGWRTCTIEFLSC